ncbi:hypothetical protein HK101_011717 [Irineochytrium annulatum]|nr:hypothetical protein HK101_011717 [Irineochytrium annulatum]
MPDEPYRSPAAAAAAAHQQAATSDIVIDASAMMFPVAVVNGIEVGADAEGSLVGANNGAGGGRRKSNDKKRFRAGSAGSGLKTPAPVASVGGGGVRGRASSKESGVSVGGSGLSGY